MAIHIKKLAVGIDDLDHLAAALPQYYTTWQGQTVSPVRTRHKPARDNEILRTGGSLYRIIKGRIQCRQKILGIEMMDDPAEGKQCLIYLDPQIIQTIAIPHRPFQGWRYLEAKDAPTDRGIYLPGKNKNDLPEDMARELKTLGLL